MSAKKSSSRLSSKSSSRSPRKTGKKRVRINDQTQVLVFEKQSLTTSPQENPHHKNPSPETKDDKERKTRELRALDNRYKNSAEIKDKRAHVRQMIREYAKTLPEEDRIIAPRRERNFTIRARPSQHRMVQPAPEKKKGFFVRMFSSKSSGGRKTQKRWR